MGYTHGTGNLPSHRLPWGSLTVVIGYDDLYQLHSRWFRLSVKTPDATHYAGMALNRAGYAC